MTEPVVTAELWIDGARFADGSTGEGDDAPVALSGLSVVWGRATTIDQVEPSTCSFDVLDPAGGDAFLGALYVGADVDVHARGVTSAPTTLPINEDPSFEADAGRVAAAVVAVRLPRDGGRRRRPGGDRVAFGAAVDAVAVGAVDGQMVRRLLAAGAVRRREPGGVGSPAAYVHGRTVVGVRRRSTSGRRGVHAYPVRVRDASQHHRLRRRRRTHERRPARVRAF